MQKLKLDLQNCYGIKQMNETIDYSNNNVAIIYAPNGTMKSSLAKTFEAIRDDRQVEEKYMDLRVCIVFQMKIMSHFRKKNYSNKSI